MDYLLEICKLHDEHVCKTTSYIYHKSVIWYPRIGVEMITVLNNHKPTFKVRQSRFVVRDLKVLDSSKVSFQSFTCILQRKKNN